MFDCMFTVSRATSLKIFFITNIVLLLKIGLYNVNCQYEAIPSISCPDIFQYLNYGGVNIGKITLRSIPPGSTVVRVRLSQKVPSLQSYSGKLSLLDGQVETINNILRGAPINYRVDFPVTNVLPKLTEISVNGSVICAAPEYTPPRTNLMLEHILTASMVGQPLQAPQYTDSLSFDPYNFIDSYNIVESNPSPSQPQSRPQEFFNFNRRTEAYPSTTESRQPAFEGFNDYRTVIHRSESDHPQPIKQTAQTSFECGKPSTRYTPLIVGGSKVQRGRFPWLAAIYENKPQALEFRCGGNLISPRTVITAAHCFSYQGIIKTPEDTLVVLGRHNLLDWSESTSVTRSVKSAELHPEYKSGSGGSFDADIAVVLLKEPVTYNNMIRPICLWNEPSNAEIIEGSEGVIVGWGQDERGQVTSVPKLVLATVVSENTCIRSKNAFSILTSNRTLCAGNRDGKGPCSGDSGSGLMLNRNDRWVLRGTVSASLSTETQKCDLEQYVVYCDVAKFVSWIRSVMI